MLIVREHEVAELLTMSDALAAVERAFAAHGRRRAHNMPRGRVVVDGARMNVMAGALEDEALFAVKSYVGGPKGEFWVQLFGLEGRLRAAIEFRLASQLRTGAASGVATRHLARPDARTVGILGTGKQAPAQLQALAAVRELDAVTAWSRSPDRLAAFCERMSTDLGLPVHAAPRAEDAVRGQDVVLTITSAAEPVVEATWLEKGAHVVLAGANRRERQEADAQVLGGADVVAVDDAAQARVESGDIWAAVEAGVLAWSDVQELGTIVSAGPRPHTGGRTVFKSLGVGFEDVAVAALIYERARTLGAGTTVTGG